MCNIDDKDLSKVCFKTSVVFVIFIAKTCNGLMNDRINVDDNCINDVNDDICDICDIYDATAATMAMMTYVTAIYSPASPHSCLSLTDTPKIVDLEIPLKICVGVLPKKICQKSEMKSWLVIATCHPLQWRSHSRH